jgi:hypothetical protein
MSAAQQMRRCGLTIASLPLDLKARTRGRTADLKDGGLRYACYSGGMAGSIQTYSTPFDGRSAHQIRQDRLNFIAVSADNKD